MIVNVPMKDGFLINSNSIFLSSVSCHIDCQLGKNRLKFIGKLSAVKTSIDLKSIKSSLLS